MLKSSIRRLFKVAIFLILLVALAVFFSYQNRVFDIERIDLSNQRVGPVRIVQLSDLHGVQFGTGNSRLLEAVLAQQPDLVVVTGDMIQYTNTASVRNAIATFLGTLNQSVPVICIPGNHEYRASTRDEFLAALRDAGVVVLENEILTVEADGSTVHLLGLDEPMGDGAVGAQTRALFAELAALPGLRVVLSHYPQYYALIGDASYQYFDFDVMFSGHAHGGQWILPGIGGLYARGQGLFPQYYRGLYDDRLVVSAGLGNSYLVPRLYNLPHIVVVQVNQ